MARQMGNRFPQSLQRIDAKAAQPLPYLAIQNHLLQKVVQDLFYVISTPRGSPSPSPGGSQAAPAGSILRWP